METKILEYEDFSSDYLVKEIGTGDTATCFLTKDNQVFKRFNVEDKRINVASLVHYSCPYITFPKKIVYSNGKIIGYIRDYAKGTEINKLSDSIEMEKLIEAIKEFNRYMMDNNYYRNLIFADLHEENILYDENENKLIIIDPDFFENAIEFMSQTNPYASMSTILYENMSWFNQGFSSFTKNCEFISPYIKEIKEEEAYGKASMSYVLKAIISEIEKITGEKIITLGDYKKQIEKAKEIKNGENSIRYR